MSDAAVAFARAIGYESAGTAEFVLDGRDFWFLELNARIQVEHPVTELVTGVDIVREQLRIASGEALSEHVTGRDLRGHAVEVRLYAEDPRSFLPQAGRLERLRLPEGIRVDSGVREGDEIGTAYDPLIAKLIAGGETREEAFDRLARALQETEIGGVTTNLPFLRWLVRHPLVRAGRVTTAFLAENPPLSEPPAAAPAEVWSEPWRLNLPSPPSRPAPDVDAAAAGHGPGGHEQSEVVAPMPGTVIRVLVEPGAAVAARQPLVVLEAMKMETPLVSPYDATVRAVHVGEGDQVAGGSGARRAGRVVETVRVSDAAAFLAEAEPLLLADEARHNLILGIAGTIRDSPDHYPTRSFWLVRDGGEVAAAALRTAPHNLILAGPRSEEALTVLARGHRARTSRVSSARSRRRWEFADLWCRQTGAPRANEHAAGHLRARARRAAVRRAWIAARRDDRRPRACAALVAGLRRRGDPRGRPGRRSGRGDARLPALVSHLQGWRCGRTAASPSPSPAGAARRRTASASARSTRRRSCAAAATPPR